MYNVRTSFNHIPWKDIHDECTVVQMANAKLPACQRCQEVDLHKHLEIVALPLEPVMWLLLYHDDDISCLDAWCLVAFTVERDGLAALHALVYVYFEHLLF